MFANGMPSVGVYRWLGGFPQQYLSSLSRESQRDSRTGTLLFACVVRPVYRYGDQTSREETGRCSDEKDDPRNRGASRPTLESITRREHAQYGVHGTVEWNDARASGVSDTHMSSCGTADRSIGNRHVPDWMHLQLLFCPSRIEQNSAPGLCMYSCYGSRSDRSSVEHSRGLDLQDRSCALGRSEKTSTFSKERHRRGAPSKTTARATSQTRLSTFTS